MPSTLNSSPTSAFIRVFLSVFLLIFLGSAVITFTMPETYLGVARVRIPAREHLQIFQSDAVLTAAAEKLELNRKLAEQYAERDPLDSQRVLKLIRRQLRLRHHPDSGTAEIRIYSPHPSEAADLANAIARAGVSRIARGDEDHPRERPDAPQPAALNSQPALKPEIIDRALPHSRPVRPNKPLNLVLGALVGALLGTFSGGVAARLALGFDRASYEKRG